MLESLLTKHGLVKREIIEVILKTNEDIFNGLEPVRNLKNEDYTKGFDQEIKYKIDRCRKKFDIEDPTIIRKQILGHFRLWYRIY